MTTQTVRIMERTLAWVVITVIGSLIAWATWSTAQVQKHETRLSVVETRTDNIYRSLDRIEQGQKDMAQKIDEIRGGKRGTRPSQ